MDPVPLCGAGRPPSLSTSRAACNPTIPNPPRSAPVNYPIHPYPLLTSLSTNLIPMPEGRGGDPGILPFHTDRTSLGLVFSAYDHISTISNSIVDQILTQAIATTSAALARDPTLSNRPLQEHVKWTHPVDGYALYIDPEVPNLTHGSLFAVLHLLRSWTRVYQAEECTFDIWAFPGTAQQKRLGEGIFILDPFPSLEGGKGGKSED
ncbi:MAG: hypothetical protein Q9176_005743 [Flavoplaca citrina]